MTTMASLPMCSQRSRARMPVLLAILLVSCFLVAVPTVISFLQHDNAKTSRWKSHTSTFMASANARLGPYFPETVDIAHMSDDDIRSELASLFNLGVMSEHIDPPLLPTVLAQVRNEMAVTRCIPFRAAQYVGEFKEPTGVVVLIHGEGNKGDYWHHGATTLARQFPHLLFVLPMAPWRALTIHNATNTTAWFDQRTAVSDNPVNVDVDKAQFWHSVDYVRSLAYTTAHRLKVPPQRIVYVGFSQGAAVALAAGLTAAPYAPAGIISVSGYLASAPDVLKNLVNRVMPVLMFYAIQDPVVPIAAAEATRDLLFNEAKLRMPVELTEYDFHTSVFSQPLQHVAVFLSRVLPQEIGGS